MDFQSEKSFGKLRLRAFQIYYQILCMLKYVKDVKDYLWHLRHALIYTVCDGMVGSTVQWCHHSRKLAAFCAGILICCVGEPFALSTVPLPLFKKIVCILLHKPHWTSFYIKDTVSTTIHVNWLDSATGPKFAVWVTFLHWWAAHATHQYIL